MIAVTWRAWENPSVRKTVFRSLLSALNSVVAKMTSAVTSAPAVPALDYLNRQQEPTKTAQKAEHRAGIGKP